MVSELRPRSQCLAAVLALAAALGVAIAPRAAHADEPAEAAQDLSAQFAAAQDLFDHQSYAEALTKFQELAKVTGSPNARLYVARTLRELGRTVEAYDEMSATVRESSARIDAEPKYEQTRDAAAAELARMEAKVAHLVIAVAGGTAPGVKLNAALVAERSLGAPITVLPGKQVVTISRPGAPDEQREIEVAAGQTKTLAITAAAGPTPKPDPGGEPESESTGGGLRIFGIVVGSVGVAGLATFVGTAVASDQKFASVEEGCGGVRCTDPKFGDEIDQGKTLELVANVTLVAGALLVAGAIPLIIFGGPTETATASVTPEVGGASLGMTLRF